MICNKPGQVNRIIRLTESIDSIEFNRMIEFDWVKIKQFEVIKSKVLYTFDEKRNRILIEFNRTLISPQQILNRTQSNNNRTQSNNNRTQSNSNRNKSNSNRNQSINRNNRII